MRKILFLNFLILLFTVNTFAQSKTKVSGFVQDVSGKPLSSISVSLIKAKDSSLTRTAINLSFRKKILSNSNAAEATQQKMNKTG